MIMYQKILAKAHEYLVVFKKGTAVNYGSGAMVRVSPNETYVLVPADTREFEFAMEQTTSDGISLKFSGVCMYRISDPVQASKLFDFSNPLEGIETISSQLKVLCLGALRDIASNLSMDTCITKRTEILSEKLKQSVFSVIEGSEDESFGFGIAVPHLHVDSVYVVGDELYGQLQSQARDKFRRIDKMSKLQTEEELEVAEIQKERKLALENFNLEKEKSERERENLQLRKDLETEKVETEAFLKMKNIQKKIEIAASQMELKKLESALNEISVHDRVAEETAMLAIRERLLPLENMPEISKNLAGIFQNSKISFYGENSIVETFAELTGSLIEKLKSGE